MKAKHVLLLILSIFILTSCVQSSLRKHQASPKKTWNINLVVTGNGSAMKVQSVPKIMPGCFSEIEGCMVFASREKGEITFSMIGSDTGFYITQLKLCKGANPPANLEDDCPLLVNALDFYVLDSSNKPVVPNLGTGKIEWAYTDKVKSFVLHNRNLLEQKYYYMAIACDGPPAPADQTQPTCLIADPPMDNKGLD